MYCDLEAPKQQRPGCNMQSIFQGIYYTSRIRGDCLTALSHVFLNAIVAPTCNKFCNVANSLGDVRLLRLRVY
jgi:hypothetical protein